MSYVAVRPEGAMCGYRRDGYSDLNRKHVADNFSCISYHILPYSKCLNWRKQIFMEIYVISSISLQYRINSQCHSIHPRHAVSFIKWAQITVLYGTQLIYPPPATETSVWYARNKWAASWQHQHSGFATSMDPDQPAHPRSLIRIHDVRYQFLYLL
jgi:hypothetical protein